MSLPIRPEKTTAGIVVDPSTLERVVPSSRRQDGTTRKELKIRPGFTPQEDIGRFRSSRAAGVDAVRNIVPGSQGRTGTKKDPYAREGEGENPFKSGTDPTPAEASAAGKSKAQLKNEKRREKRRTEVVVIHDTTLKWDEDEDVPGDQDKGEDMKEAFERMDRLNLGEEEPLGTGSKAVGGGAPEESVSSAIAISSRQENASTAGIDSNLSAPPLTDPPTSSSPTDPKSSPPPAAADVQEGAASLVQPEVTERDWKNARQPQAGRGGRGGTQRGASRGGANGRGSRGHGRGHAPGSAPAPQKTAEPQPRVRKEVKVREGTAGGASSLADRVRGLLVGNQERPRRTAATTTTAEENKA